MGRKFGFSFSWKRAVGLSAAKGKLSRKIGIPLTRSGRQRKVGQLAGCCIPFVAIITILGMASSVFAHSGGTDANGGHYNRKTGEYHYHNGGSNAPAPSSGTTGSGSGGFGSNGPGYYPPKAQTAQPAAPAQSLKGLKLQAKIVGVTDGDTLVALDANNTQAKLRLHGVDTPESSQAFGTKAKQFTSDLCFGKTVQLDILDTDRYGRLVAVVTLADGKVLNQELVRAGMAWWYEQYAPNDATLKSLQDQAKAAKLGLWADANPTPPWDFRRGGPTPETPSNVVPNTGTTAPQMRQQAPQAEPQAAEVYVTNTGKKYHRAGCRYLAKSMIPMELSKAKQIYGPCSVCSPPR